MRDDGKSAAASPGAIWCAIPVLIAAFCVLFVRVGLGFQFPVPWPDETGFVAPAFDFARTGSFFDPGLNPDRVVMWMPPGYMLLLASVFRVFGYSFALARWVSTLCCLGALGLGVGLVFRLCRGWRRFAGTCALSAAFASPMMLSSANIARMEMPFAALMLLALWQAVAGRIYLAAALVAAGSVLHFNAIYFAVPLLLLFAWRLVRHCLPRPSRAEIVGLFAAALILTAYALYVAANWPGFRADMAFQFAWKRFVGSGDVFHPELPLIALMLTILTCLQGERTALVAMFGCSFLFMAYEGHELWYDYGRPLGFACITVGLLGLPDGASQFRYRASLAAATLAGALVVATSLWITAPLRSLLPARAMLHRDVVAATEIRRVRAFIATLPPGSTVDFGWTGLEPFFFKQLAHAGAHWTIIRHSVTQVWPLRRADWRIVCDSREWPKALLRFDIDYPRRGVDQSCRIIRLKQP